MKSLIRSACLPVCLLLCGVAWLGLDSAVASGQEGSPDAQPEIHNALESITGTLEVNEGDLLSALRLLPDLAVRLFSGNRAELLSGNSPELLSGNSPELLSGNSPELLSGNAPELLSGNETSLLCENDPTLLSGNKMVLFSHNTLQIHLAEVGNNSPAQGAPEGNQSALRARWGSLEEQVKRQEARTQAQLKAAESRAKAVIEKEKAQAKKLVRELSLLRTRLQELAAQNSDLQAKIAELETAKQ